MKRDEFAQACERLLLSTDFAQLKGTLEFSTPNLWHILDISRREVRVSRFLAWLLDPQAAHSFGAEFLRGLLVEALQTEVGRQSGITPVDVLVLDLSNVRVETEHPLGARRCDIVAFSPGEGAAQNDGLLCMIENKVDASEGPDQTRDYYERGRKVFPPEHYPVRVHLYLSPDGDPPQQEDFIPVSYQIIADVVGRVKEGPHVSEAERFLLQQFQESVLRRVAVDSETLDLAQEVYDRYQDVLEFIIQSVDRRPESDPSEPEREWDGKSRFLNTGERPGSGYRWADYREYGFVCAGGGSRYRDWMEQIQLGDVIYAYVSGRGYVGVGTVTERAAPFRKARLKDGRRLAALDLVGEYNDSEDDDNCDWIALVEWEHAVPKERAVKARPATPATTCRIYEYRKEAFQTIRAELQERAA